MKSRALLPVCGVAVFLTSAGFAFQQQAAAPTEPLAEQTYKNIQIFKGQPASVVRPAMDGITAALGVKCSYCHVQDAQGNWQFEKDDKDHKQTARKMYLMMKQIDDQNFDGDMDVTCATCHQGHSSPNRIPPLGEAATPGGPGGPGGSGGPGAAPNATMPKAEDLIAKYVDAIGGSAAVGKVTGITMKGTFKADEESADVEIDAKAPNKIFSVLTFPNGAYTEVFDGTTGWEHFGTGPTTKIEGTDLATLKGSSPLYYINPALTYSSFRRVRKDTLDGNDVYVIDVQPGDDGTRIRLFFDANTNLLTRVWYGKQTVVGIVPATEDYSDYRDVSGVKIPFKVVDTTGDGVRTFAYTDIKVDGDIPDSKFAAPK